MFSRKHRVAVEFSGDYRLKKNLLDWRVRKVKLRGAAKTLIAAVTETTRGNIRRMRYHIRPDAVFVVFVKYIIVLFINNSFCSVLVNRVFSKMFYIWIPDGVPLELLDYLSLPRHSH